MKLHNELLIKKWEVFGDGKGNYPPVLEAYMPTPNDVPTIGWGHTHTVKMGDVITEEKAQELFERDIAWAVAAVNREVNMGLTQNQFDALVSFVFNVGESAFGRSTLLRKLNAGDYEGAAREFPRWNKQAGIVLKGLTRRRAHEMELFLEPDSVEDDSFSFASTVDEAKPLKSLAQSKETVGGVTALLTGVGGLVGSLTETAQTVLVAGVSVALVAFAAMIIWNRLNARAKGER